jgi:hypothetical protein
MADVFERNGSQPAQQQDFPGYMLRLGVQGLRNATSPLSPTPQPRQHRGVPPPQPERGR